MPPAEVYEAYYKGLKSFVTESEAVRVELVPSLGGKIVSLRHKITGKEWMLDSGGCPLRIPVYGSAFTEWDMSGWDECFPTIDRCPAGERGEASLPDHGEVWSVPWEVEAVGNAIVGTVCGRSSPYRFSRTVKIVESHSISLRYEVMNTGGTTLAFLWAAHPQFNVDEPTRIMTPGDMRSLRCVFGGRSHLQDALYEVQDIWNIGTGVSGDGAKFYYPDQVNTAWSGLYGMQSRNYLLLKADKERVPYWGVWIDRGLYNDRTTIALEPCIGYYDSRDRAVKNGTAVRLLPGQRYQWQLELELGAGIFKPLYNSLCYNI